MQIPHQVSQVFILLDGVLQTSTFKQVIVGIINVHARSACTPPFHISYVMYSNFVC